MTQNIGIYKWTNKINGKVYIGQSVKLRNRKNEFLNFNSGYSGNLINRARQKYNSTDFWQYEVLEYCKPAELNEKEIYYIDLYNSTDRKIGYNISIGGSNSNLVGENNSFYGKHHTEETKELISNKVSKPIYQIDKDTNEIIREWKSACEASRVLGIRRKTINNCCLKKPHNKTAGGFKWCYKEDFETIDFASYKNPRSRIIYQIDLITGEIINKYDCITEAAEKSKLHHSSISACCRGKYKMAGGYKWCYKVGCLTE